MCLLENAVEVKGADGVLRWIVACSPTANWATRHSVLRELPPSAPLASAKVLKSVAALEPGNLGLVSIIDSPIIDGDLEAVISKRLGLPTAMPNVLGLTVASMGDCSTGNPGHCQADQHLLFIMQHLLHHTRETTRVVLVDGFGGGRYKGAASLAERQRPYFLEDWRAFARSVVTAKPLDNFPLQRSDPLAYSRRLKLVAMAPKGFVNGPHWRMFKSNNLVDCQAKSEVLVGANLVQFAYMEKRWAQDLSGRFADACSFVASLSRLANVLVFNSDACRVSRTASNVLVWLSRKSCIGDGCPQVSSGRVVVNGERLARELAEATGKPVVFLNPGASLEYIDQVYLINVAEIVIGMHGGAMHNAARWLNGAIGQRMIEIMPVDGPGTSCHIAKMTAGHTAYQSVLCTGCDPRHSFTSEMPLDGLVAVVRSPPRETNCAQVR